ncbi:MAG: DUF3501 family protein [Gammaproteobacteria bacterium]|nr:DUF3501 family protein [Gammaproteobacteria bacterium]
MQKLTRNDLLTLEAYAAERPDFRDRVMRHKQNRIIRLGEHAALFFEDRLTMQYQIQEMLRAERIFEAAGIDEELAAYNPMIPDGSNWKATFMLQYDDEQTRRIRLGELRGIESRVWVQVGSQPRVFAVADEDLERENEEKTSAVHFLRFELPAEMIAALTAGGALEMGIDHPAYRDQVRVSEASRLALIADLDTPN